MRSVSIHVVTIKNFTSHGCNGGRKVVFMKNEKYYVVDGAKFIGGYYEPDHETVTENVDEIYSETMLFQSLQDPDRFMILRNDWEFYGVFGHITQSAQSISKSEAEDFIENFSWYTNWTTDVNEIMYDVSLIEDEIYFWKSETGIYID